MANDFVIEHSRRAFIGPGQPSMSISAVSYVPDTTVVVRSLTATSNVTLATSSISVCWVPFKPIISGSPLVPENINCDVSSNPS